mgnify:CR=1 FL=1
MNVLELQDLNLAYHRAGAGAPLVFLHGWPEWSGIWRKVLPDLETRFDVIAPDLRNFGDSRGDEARDVDHYVSDLEALVDYLGLDRFGIVSHDVGGFLALDYARRHPDRLACSSSTARISASGPAGCRAGSCGKSGTNRSINFPWRSIWSAHPGKAAAPISATSSAIGPADPMPSTMRRWKNGRTTS